MSSPPNNPRLIASLKKTFADLRTPLDMSIRNVWRGADRPPDGKMVLDNQLLSVAKQFVDVRNCSVEQKQSYFETICDWFDLASEENAFPLPARQSFDPNISERLERVPVVSPISKNTTAGMDSIMQTGRAMLSFSSPIW